MLEFNPSNNNHELCHRTDGITRMLGCNPNNIKHELCHYADDATCMM
jgi:hypothetical protein